MAIYERFSCLYATGPYSGYSLRIAAQMPSVLARLGAHPATLLDIACGEGAFAVAMARAGLAVTALDRSEDMLAWARRRAAAEGAAVKFVRTDMRSFALGEKFDLVTCWYDSLNYLTASEDLGAAFQAARCALTPTGIFIFDMNTASGLAWIARSHPVYIQQNRPDAFEVHVDTFNSTTNLAIKRIGGLVKCEGQWTAVEEEHCERAYSLGEIRALLASSGLREIACWGSIEKMTEPLPDSGRVWFVAKGEGI